MIAFSTMSHPTKGTVYALLAAIGLLLAGLAVLVWVDSRRVSRYADEINALHYRLDSQEVEIRRLRRQTQADTSRLDNAVKDNWN